MADQQGITTAVERMDNEPNAAVESTATDGPAVEVNDDTQAGESGATGAMQDADIARDNGVDPNQMVAATTEDTVPTPTSSPASEPASEPSARRNATPELSDSLRPMENMEGGEEREVANGASYEIIYIVRPDQADAPQGTATRARTLIEAQGGAVDNIRTSETRRLAYTINKQIEGVYVVVNCRLVKKSVPEVDRFFKLEESVLRHMIVTD